MFMSLGVATPSNAVSSKANTASPYKIEWSHTYGGVFYDTSGSVIPTTDSGYAFSGLYGLPNFKNALWLVKTNSSGYHEWNQTFWWSYEWTNRGLIHTTDSGYALLGKHPLWKDVILVKTDASGHQEWNQTLVTLEEAEIIKSLVQTADEGYIIAGGIKPSSTSERDFWLMKVNSTGHHEWNRTYGGSGDESVWSIVHTIDGGFALSGSTSSYGAGEKDIWLVKVNSTGNHEWNQTFGDIKSDYSHSLIQTTDGGFAIAGATTTFEYSTEDTYIETGVDFWLVKTDKNGLHEWNRTFDNSNDEYASNIIQTSDNGFVLTGWSPTSEGDWFVKVNSTGHHEWDETFVETDISSLLLTNDGGIVLGGSTQSDIGNKDAYLMKISFMKDLTSGTSGFEVGLVISFLIMMLMISRKRKQKAKG